MKLYLYLILMIVCLSCKPEVIETRKADILDSLGFEDYREIVRHPISLEESLDTSQWSHITFNEEEFVFDTIVEGETVDYSFDFINSGSKPLYILDTRVSCGCTVASFPTKPIEPGGSGTIKVKFDSKGKAGTQLKSILVLSNSHPNENRLFIKGFVKKNKNI